MFAPPRTSSHRVSGQQRRRNIASTVKPALETVGKGAAYPDRTQHPFAQKVRMDSIAGVMEKTAAPRISAVLLGALLDFVAVGRINVSTCYGGCEPAAPQALLQQICLPAQTNCLKVKTYLISSGPCAYGQPGPNWHRPSLTNLSHIVVFSRAASKALLGLRPRFMALASFLTSDWV